jgi:hypothetical protein
MPAGVLGCLLALAAIAIDERLLLGVIAVFSECHCGVRRCCPAGAPSLAGSCSERRADVGRTPLLHN